MTPTLGLALIARDEAATLPTLFRSIRGAFDQVALLDTGSTDETVVLFERWASAENLSLGYVVERFEWRDDFAAARAAADALLDADWLAWADCDDRIAGAECLRDVASQAEAVGATWIRAAYILPCRTVARERVFRRGHGRWRFPVHESKLPDGGFVELQPTACRWEHGRDARPSSFRRNLRIARAWIEREPDDPFALYTAAREELAAGFMLDDPGGINRGLCHALDFLRQWSVKRVYGPRRLAAARRLLELARAGDAEALIDLVAVGLIDPRTWLESTLQSPSSAGMGKASSEVKTGKVSPSPVSPRVLRSTTSA